ncbi:MAG: potassium channel protein [Deltaproteobacteria bacterium]|nr:potassium channel protein [Deltaproteobacteria bacterium]
MVRRSLSVTYDTALIKALLALLVVLVFGTLGYRAIEGWDFLDALYMTVITLTTIGFGEVRPLDRVGKIFTLGLIIVGVGVVGYTLVTATRLIVEGEINAIFKRRRSMKTIQRLENHMIICGFGRMGSFICHELHQRGIQFVVVENGQHVQERIVELGYLLSPGDATEEEVLRAAGVDRARGVVSVLNTDAQNVYTILTCKEINPNLDVVARATEDAAVKKLVRAGASRVINPYEIGGMRLVLGILKPTVVSFLEVVMDSRQLNVELEEVCVAGESVYVGKRLVDTDIRKELDLIVIGAKKKDGTMVFNPGPATVVDAQDTLIAMGKQEMLEIFRERASA